MFCFVRSSCVYFFFFPISFLRFFFFFLNTPAPPEFSPLPHPAPFPIKATRWGTPLRAKKGFPPPPQAAPAVRADGRPAPRGARYRGRHDRAAPDASLADG